MSHGGFPQLHTKSEDDTLSHFEVSGNAVKRDTQSTSVWNSYAIPSGLILLDWQGDMPLHLLQAVTELHSCRVFLFYFMLITFLLYSVCGVLGSYSCK